MKFAAQSMFVGFAVGLVACGGVSKIGDVVPGAGGGVALGGASTSGAAGIVQGSGGQAVASGGTSGHGGALGSGASGSSVTSTDPSYPWRIDGGSCVGHLCGEHCEPMPCAKGDIACEQANANGICDLFGICWANAVPYCQVGLCQYPQDCGPPPPASSAIACPNGDFQEVDCVSNQCALTCSGDHATGPHCQKASDCASPACIKCADSSCAKTECVQGVCEQVCVL